jgi:hypothetical protein
MQSGKWAPPKQKSVIIMLTMVRASSLNLFYCNEGKVQEVSECYSNVIKNNFSSEREKLKNKTAPAEKFCNYFSVCFI